MIRFQTLRPTHPFQMPPLARLRAWHELRQTQGPEAQAIFAAADEQTELAVQAYTTARELAARSPGTNLYEIARVIACVLSTPRRLEKLNAIASTGPVGAEATTHPIEQLIAVATNYMAHAAQLNRLLGMLTEEVPLPATLVRGPHGLEVSNILTPIQQVGYERLQLSYSKDQINNIVTLHMNGGIDALADDFGDMSIDDLAIISVLENDINATTSAHDAAHVILGRRSNIVYGVKEWEEVTGDSLVNHFIGTPGDLYRYFIIISRDSLPKIEIPTAAKTAILDAFYRTNDAGERSIDFQFKDRIAFNSQDRIDRALASTVSKKSAGSSPAENSFLFVEQLKSFGQFAGDESEAVIAKIKGLYVKYEKLSSRGTTPLIGDAASMLRYPTVFEVSSLLTKESISRFKNLPDDDKFKFLIDGIAMVLSAHYMHQDLISLPTTSDTDRFTEEWLISGTGATRFSEKGYVRTYLTIRNQIRKAFDIQ